MTGKDNFAGVSAGERLDHLFFRAAFAHLLANRFHGFRVLPFVNERADQAKVAGRGIRLDFQHDLALRDGVVEIPRAQVEKCRQPIRQQRDRVRLQRLFDLLNARFKWMGEAMECCDSPQLSVLKCEIENEVLFTPGEL